MLEKLVDWGCDLPGIRQIIQRFPFLKKILNAEVISYLFFGVLTTIVNFVVYFACTNIGQIHYLVANALAWFAAVTFAYVTNKIIVFESKASGLRQLFREAVSFYGFRLLSGVMDMAIMFVSVSLIGISDGAAKLITQIVVTILNYLFSKFFIFNK